MKTKRNGGSASIEQVAKDWKVNGTKQPVSTEPSSKWASTFTNNERKAK